MKLKIALFSNVRRELNQRITQVLLGLDVFLFFLRVIFILFFVFVSVRV